MCVQQARSALLLVGNISLVLDEDGTGVETEEFFQTLEDGTVLVVLTKGQTWRPAKVSRGALKPATHQNGHHQGLVFC